MTRSAKRNPKNKSARDPAKTSRAVSTNARRAYPQTNKPAGNSKLGTLAALLRQPKGASLAELSEATGWQLHSVRGAISGSLKKKLGLKIVSAKVSGVRTYRIVK